MTGGTKLWKAAAKHAATLRTVFMAAAVKHFCEGVTGTFSGGYGGKSPTGVSSAFGSEGRNDPMPQTITQTVTDYVHAMAYADEGLMRDVFDPRASIVGTFEGETEWLSLEDFVDQMRKTERGLPDHDPTFEIIGIDKEGDSASVKLTTSFDGMDFYEYLSLLEHEGNWSIVHKLYHIKR